MDVAANRQVWDREHDWRLSGEEWSAAWGSSRAQWQGTLLPRIQSFVPARTILEIAPGAGRWTQFLVGLCERLVVVDLSPTCIDACKRRFPDARHIEYHVNDGVSLSMIPDRSIDFVFSFDSLVHADRHVLEGYLNQIAAKLTPNGAGFIHHSNLGAYRWLLWGKRLCRPPLDKPLLKAYLRVIDENLRDRSVTAAGFRALCEKAGLACIRQEIINWTNTRRCIDCLSTFTSRGSVFDAPPVVIRNPDFMLEAERVRRTLRAQ